MTTPFNPQNQTQSQPKKKASMRSKILLGGVGVVAILGIIGACSPTDNDTTPTASETRVSAPATSETRTSTRVESPASESPSPMERRLATRNTAEQQTPEQQAGVPREYEQALKKAERYLRVSAFSEQGLFKQLTSEHGAGFTPEAAQYAMDNVEVDWNEQAVKKAERYLKVSAFSEQRLYDQLTSEYGSGFTPEQAQYAISVVY